MRVVVFVLVLSNLLLFAFSQGYFGAPENPDAQRLQQQVSPEKIKLLDPAVAVAKAASPVLPLSADPLEKPAKSGSEASLPKCLVWNGLLQSEGETLVGRIGKRFPGLKLKQLSPAPTGTWWVFIPALPTKAAAEARVEALQQKGINDYMLMQEGPNRNAISLGIFSSESGATERLKEVQGKGFDTARLAPRRKEAAYAVEARGAESDLADARKASASILPDTRPQACK